jgi:hypothetical protein
MKDSNPKGAIEQYFLLLDSEEPMSEKAWSAKCINEIINIKIKKNDLDDMNEVIKKLLAYINNMSKYDRGITIDCIFNAVNKIGNLAKKKEVEQRHPGIRDTFVLPERERHDCDLDDDIAEAGSHLLVEQPGGQVHRGSPVIDGRRYANWRPAKSSGRLRKSRQM